MQVRDVVVEVPNEGPGSAASAVVLRTNALTLRSLPTAIGCDSSAGTGSAGGAQELEALEALLQSDSQSEANVTAAIEAVRACSLFIKSVLVYLLTQNQHDPWVRLQPWDSSLPVIQLETARQLSTSFVL